MIEPVESWEQWTKTWREIVDAMDTVRDRFQKTLPGVVNVMSDLTAELRLMVPVDGSEPDQTPTRGQVAAYIRTAALGLQEYDVLPDEVAKETAHHLWQALAAMGEHDGEALVASREEGRCESMISGFFCLRPHGHTGDHRGGLRGQGTEPANPTPPSAEPLDVIEEAVRLLMRRGVDAPVDGPNELGAILYAVKILRARPTSKPNVQIYQDRYNEDQSKIAELRELLDAATRAGEVWVWEADGDNDVDSLVCPVLITAEALRNLLAASGTSKFCRGTETCGVKHAPCGLPMPCTIHTPSPERMVCAPDSALDARMVEAMRRALVNGVQIECEPGGGMVAWYKGVAVTNGAFSSVEECAAEAMEELWESDGTLQPRIKAELAALRTQGATEVSAAEIFTGAWDGYVGPHGADPGNVCPLYYDGCCCPPAPIEDVDALAERVSERVIAAWRHGANAPGIRRAVSKALKSQGGGDGRP